MFIRDSQSVRIKPARAPRQKLVRTLFHLAPNRIIAESLINQDFDVNTKDNESQTSLDCARDSGHTEIDELLDKYGAKE